MQCGTLQGGIAALIGSAMVGPRLGRFREGKVVDDMPGSSTVLVVLGTFILWFGWCVCAGQHMLLQLLRCIDCIKKDTQWILQKI